MFERLFAESGLSLDRLKSLLEVGAAGSITKATHGDPVKQSQFSRQIKELEDFFRVKLVERQGKGLRFTKNGRELARISRFFLLGLSNFQRGCLAEEQEFRIGAGATFIQQFLLPVLTDGAPQTGMHYAVETVNHDEIERRLHDLTLDFAITTAASLSRPLQLLPLGECALHLWVPKALYKNEARAATAFRERRLPLIVATNEMPAFAPLSRYRPALVCTSFIEARAALAGGALATFLPDYLPPKRDAFIRVRVPDAPPPALRYHLAWNPRLLRLNPHAARRRDFLGNSLSAQLGGQ